MRRHQTLTMDQLQRIATSKRVPCPFRPCSAPVDVRCVNTSDTTSRMAPLGGLGAHVARLRAAEQAPPAPTPSATPSPRSAPERASTGPSRELVPA